METEKRFELITRNTEEVLTPDELRNYLEIGMPLKHYIGFEISGFIHLGTGLMTMAKVKDFIEAEVKCNVFLADWHTWINNKLGGDFELIKKVAVGYFKEGMKASMLCWKGDPEKIGFILGSELYAQKDKLYWETVIDVSRHTTLARVLRSITIMGRKEGEAVNFAQLLYPPMQVADIFAIGVNLAHGGIDQRKAHVIAKEVAKKLVYNALIYKGEKYEPIAIHHPLLMGLQPPPKWPIKQEEIKQVISEMKMSKSIPYSAIFIHDSEEEIKQKIDKAFCPEGNISYNPILQYTKLLLFNQKKFVLNVERERKYGGDIAYDSYEKLEQDFAQKKLHPKDLKNAVALALIKLLEPARKYFKQPRIKKLLEGLKGLKITR